MPHETALIATIAAGLGLAFLLGLLAVRLKLPPIVGYLVAGIALGPRTPGFIADAQLAAQLAEIGVILLMFGVGMHFSVRDLLAVRRIALPGAVAQISAATAMGAAVAHWWWGWTWGAGIVFGLALSVASTVVLLRALEARGILDSIDGRIAVGWLIVEDLAMVLALVILPAFAIPLGGSVAGAGEQGTSSSLWVAIGVTLLKVSAFVGLMLVVGARVVPWLLERVARTGSRELFTLSVLAVALGIAFGAAALFGVSFALGAFFAGVVISESELSHQAAADALPFQDAFAVLFFVSVGMLFDPAVLLEEPLHVAMTVLIIMVGKSAAAFGIVLLFRYPVRTALTVSASLAQIGEFSFILAGLGVTLGLLPREGQSLILAGAIFSITLSPVVFGTLTPIARWLSERPRLLDLLERPAPELRELPPSANNDGLHGHAIIVGFGRVGETIGRALARESLPFVAVEQDRERVDMLRRRGIPALYGDAARTDVLDIAGVARARLLVIAAPDAFQSRRIFELARKANPALQVIVRTHSEAEQRYIEQQGACIAVMGERQLALGMARFALAELEVDAEQIEAVLGELRETAVSAGTLVSRGLAT
jgi:CPA2 family monovalent cation:H+ antiporter-2